MNGQVPSDIDLAPMLEQEVLAFTIGEHHIVLSFTDMRLIVEAGYELSQPHAQPQPFPRDSLAVGAELLPSLVSQTIQSAQWVGGKGLLIGFSNGAQFSALTDSSGYECFSFNLPHQSGIVVV